MAYDTDHAQRIKQELIGAGVTALGLAKFNMRYLPNVIGEDEHIKAVAYGRYREIHEQASWNWEEGALVATDKRALFLDRKPGFLRADNIEYSTVSGVLATKAWIFTAITLLTGVGTFSLRYVRNDVADKFVGYVERRRRQPVAQESAT